MPEIDRDDHVRTLELYLDGDVEIVIVEGPDGMGKSTVLGQFAAAHPDRTVHLLLSGASRWAYDSQQLARDMYAQIQSLTGATTGDAEVVDSVALGKAYSDLSRLSRREGRHFYFVVDGIEDIPDEDEAAKAAVIDLLPLGRPGLRFLLSARSGRDLPFRPQARRLIQGYPLSLFGIEETRRYLSEFNLSSEQIREILSATRGLPGKLASIRRLLGTGRDAGDLIQNLPEEMPGLFDLEWDQLDLDDHLRFALALLAHEARSYTSTEVAEILGLERESLEAKLGEVPFLQPDDQGYLQFDSATTRRFVSSRLVGMRQSVNEALIKYLSNDPESVQSLVNLPKYFTSAERLQDLVRYLSPERFARIYRETPSVRTVQQHADRGIAAAEELGRHDDLVRFTLQRSAIEEIASSNARVGEVRARTAVGDYESALGIAESTVQGEARFRLLVAIARARKDRSLPEDEDLTARIRSLFHDLDPTSFRDQLPDVAADLFSVDPELAIDLVSRRETGGEPGENALDWARTGLVIQAQLDAEDPNAKKQARELREQIRDPDLKQFSMHAVAVLGHLDAAEIIGEAERLESTGDRLFLLQHWMIGNRKRKDAADVLEFGLRSALQATNYTATARVFRELALCLPHLSEEEVCKRMLDWLDGQKGILEQLGPSEDYVRLRLIMARAAARFNAEAAQERLADIYNEISQIPDKVVRQSSTARLAATLARLSSNGAAVDPTLRQVVEDDLKQGVDELLTESADHFEVCKGVIAALGAPRPELAMQVIAAINTGWRRNLARKWFVESALAAPLVDVPFTAVEQALREIDDPEVHNLAVEALAKRLEGRRAEEVDISEITPVIRAAMETREPSTRVTEGARIATWLADLGNAGEELRREVMTCACESWEGMDSGYQRLEAGFHLLSALASAAPEKVQKYTERVNKLKDQLHLQDVETTIAAHLGVSLAVRAFAGIAGRNVETDSDLERLYATLERSGGVADQARLLSELAIRCNFKGRADLCTEIVQDRLLPLLGSLSHQDPAYREQIIADCAPALVIGSPAVGEGLVKALPRTLRDEALSTTAWTILRQVPPGDAYDHQPHQGFEIGYEDACAVVGLIGDLQEDWRIYDLLEAVVESVLTSHSKIKRPQKADIARRLENVVEDTLPAVGGIEHHGYKVVSWAHINRLRLPAEALSSQQFAEDARAIPNTADRAYVLAVIGATAPKRKERLAYLQEARSIADGIPILVDRLDLYQLISALAQDTDPNWSKDLLTHAVSLALRGEGASVADRRRSLINVAYRVDPEYAAGLAQLSDDDPAKSKVERQLQIYKVRDAIAERRPPEDIPSVGHLEMARAAWLKLAALNAGRVSATSARYALPLLQHAAPLPVSRSYPIFAFYIENAVRHAPNAQALRTYVTPLFEACLRGAELAVLTAERSTSHRVVRITAGKDPGLLTGGDREKGLGVMKEWAASLPGGTRFFISEPYFRPSDTHLLSIIKEAVPDARVTILTSRTSVGGISGPYQDAYFNAWRRTRYDDPPETRVVIAETRDSKKCPAHDRWWLTEGLGGLDLGTSYGGIGSRISHVTRLSDETTAARLSTLAPYFEEQRAEFHGEQVRYTSFTL